MSRLFTSILLINMLLHGVLASSGPPDFRAPVVVSNGSYFYIMFTSSPLKRYAHRQERDALRVFHRLCRGTTRAHPGFPFCISFLLCSNGSAGGEKSRLFLKLVFHLVL